MEEIDNNIPFFEKLKQVRIEKNIELDKMAEKSRIQKRYLLAIEDGQFDEIPDIYDKLFFQTYLNFLGLDAEKEEHYLQEFRRFRKISEPQHTTTIRRIKTQATSPYIVERFKKLYIAVPIILIVLIIIVLALNSTRVSETESEPVKELSVRQVVKNIEQSQENDGKKANEAVAVDLTETITKKPVSVGIRATEDTWLRMIKDKSDTSEYLLRINNNLTISADSTMEFLIGKANGINMIVNSIPVGKLGRSGEVVSYMKITEKGIVAKRLKKVEVKRVSNDTISEN